MKPNLLILFILSLCTSSYLNAQNIVWDNQLGSSSSEDTYFVYVDSNDNIYTVGAVGGTADMDPSFNTYNLGAGPFVQKLDAAGNFLWAKNIPFTGNTVRPEKMVVDNAGNVYTIGYFEGTVDFDPGPAIFNLTCLSVTGYFNIYIQKLDANGDFVWAKAITGNNDARSSTIMLTPNHTGVYVTGMFWENVDMDPGAGTYNFSSATSTDSDKFLLKLDSSGNFIWAKQFGGTTNNPLLNMMLVDDLGHLHAYGSFSGTVDFDLGAGTHNETALGGLSNIFLLELDSNANFLNFNTFTFVGSGAPSVFDIDTEGNIYFGGKMFNNLTFNQNGSTPVTLTNGGNSDAFVLKIDSTGNFLWARSFSSFSGDDVKGLVVDPSGYVYTTGQFSGEVDFDPSYGEVIYDGSAGPHAYVHKFAPNGNYVWVKHLYANVFDSENVVLDSELNVYVSGHFGFGNALGGTYFPNGSTDILILKLEQDSCSNMVVNIDSVADMTCISLGLVQVTGLNGSGNYTYSWDNPLVSTSPSIVIDSAGLYTVTVTDSIGCSINKSILVNGPISNSVGSFDLNSNLLAAPFRTGTTSTLWGTAFNHGCLPTNGTLTVILSPLVTFDSASIVPNSINGDTLMWNFSNLEYGINNLEPIIYVTTSLTAQIGDSICITVQIAPESGDINIGNNIKHYCYRVINSYDPNIKAAYPQGICAPQYVSLDERMTYTVQFQNTGNASAIDINVLDTLSGFLDINTIQVLGTSHPQLITEILLGNVVKFGFEGIYLPDSASNESASHGYVIFEINPIQTIPNNTLVENRVSIYFDYNDPIVTNKAFNTFLDSLPDLNVLVNQNVDTLWASMSPFFTNYQWLDCNNGNQAIAGANNPYFVPSQNGNYSVVLSGSGCSIISECFAYNFVGMNPLEIPSFKVYPNPTQALFYIDKETSEPINIEVLDNLGRVLISKSSSELSTQIDLFDLPHGIYYLSLNDGDKIISCKVVKQ